MKFAQALRDYSRFGARNRINTFGHFLVGEFNYVDGFYRFRLDSGNWPAIAIAPAIEASPSFPKP
jgi:hypothetical protein